jgi:hypothetical protein
MKDLAVVTLRDLFGRRSCFTGRLSADANTHPTRWPGERQSGQRPARNVARMYRQIHD